MFFAAHFDYRWMHKLVWPAYLGTYALLLAVLVYGVAAGVAQRWIVIGPINLQPSEIMKLALVLVLASYSARYQEQIIDYSHPKRATLMGNFIPFAIVLISVLPVALERHLSGTIIIAVIGIVVIFASGALKRWFVAAGIGGILAVVAASMTPYVQERLDTYFHPENYWNPQTGQIHADIWQTVQGLIAVGSGGIFGVGLGNSRQKHSFVPMPHNDFVFSIICEELGLIGAVGVILLFFLFIWRGFTIARRAPDTFSSLVVIGITTQVGLQAILNMMVVTSLIPNTGVSLPFFSYGGTSLLMLLGEMGIILSISRYSYQKQ
jgi:cell division protein FtsW